MNRIFQVIELLWSCLVPIIRTPFALTKRLTQIFVDCKRFNKGKINQICTEWTLKKYTNKRHTDKMRTKLNKTHSSNNSGKYSHKQDKTSK